MNLDDWFASARSGDTAAFGRWAEGVHGPVRASLRRFARVVDVEVVVQETLLRMWMVACDPRKNLEGENASLRYAVRVARNVALEELRRSSRERTLPIDEQPFDPPVQPVPSPDPALRAAIEECFERLPGQPKAALGARLLNGGRRADRELAALLEMKPNTFLQNIVRARRFLADCLDGKGVDVRGIAS